MKSKSALPLLIALVVLVGTSNAGAQPPAPAGADIAVQPGGAVVVRNLPRTGPPPIANRAIELHVPDRDVLNATKQAFGTPRSQPVPGPETLAQTTTSGTAQANGGAGLQFSNSGGYVPPDTQVGVSPNWTFEAVNLEGRIWSRSSGTTVTFSLYDLFGLPTSALLSDPKIRFDPVSERWFVAIVNYNGSFTAGAWLLAVSASEDPTGGFTRYTISTSTSAPDFPALAVNSDKVVLTANAFRGSSFAGTEFVVLNKANLVGATTVAGKYYAPPQGLFTIQPGHALSSCAAGTPCPLYMAAVGYNSTTTMRVWTIHGVPGVSTVTLSAVNLSIATLTSPPDAPQKGTSTLIATNDNRLLEASYRSGALWLAANSACKPSGDTTTRACLRFVKVSTTSGITKQQDFDFGTAGVYYYYPAVQTDGSGNLISAFSSSSAASYAGVFVSGQRTTDPVNSFQTPVVAQPGLNAYTPFANRWGDYSGAAIDPSDPGVVLVGGEYAAAAGGSDWGTFLTWVQMQ